MPPIQSITTADVRAALHYDPDTGVFTWRTGHRAGKRAGGIRPVGNGHRYWTIGLHGRQYYAHRLAWFYMTGNWPADRIDHIDRDGLNNRFANLRECTHAQNLANSNARKDNTKGVKGVYRTHHRTKPYRAEIQLNGKRHHLGYFATATEASTAYQAEARRLLGDFVL